MKKLRIGLVGASGRMGQEILKLAAESNKYEVCAEVNRSNGSLSNVKGSSIDVIIDVSLPEGFQAALEWCVKNKKPLVSGTTGLSTQQLKAIEKAGMQIPILWSPNMSIGIAMLQRALSAMGHCDGFDLVIEETHHKRKKDRPSGTAILLKKTIEQKMKRKIDEPLSMRGGGVFGIHKVHFLSEDEALCFEHQALNRRVFASGALTAAEWLFKKKPSVYKMADVLGEKQ